MWKIVGSFIAGVAFVSIVGWNSMSALMFSERVSPFGMDETVARIQHNIVANKNGWALSGLRNPAAAVQADGGNTLPVMMVEACSTAYSKPILNEDSVRYLSILMPCKISVYKKNDGKVYIGTMNAALMGKMFGPLVGEIMGKVAIDQQSFIVMDPSKPTPQIIQPKAATGGGAGGAAASGC